MMLNKGRRGHTSVLSEHAVLEMTRDQLTPDQRIGADLFFGGYASWGYGMGIDLKAEQPWNIPGRFGWAGGFGTCAYSDPRNDFIGILFTQMMLDSPEAPAIFNDFWSHAYQSIAD